MRVSLIGAMTDKIRGLLAQLVREIAAHSELEKPPEPTAQTYDADMVYRFLLPIAPTDRQRRPLMQFAGWLWKTGTHDMGKVLAIVEDRIRRAPRAPYSFYAPGGPAREAKESAYAISFAQREAAAFNEADARFLGQGSPNEES